MYPLAKGAGLNRPREFESPRLRIQNKKGTPVDVIAGCWISSILVFQRSQYGWLALRFKVVLRVERHAFDHTSTTSGSRICFWKINIEARLTHPQSLILHIYIG
jgi:hypothetical protein